VNEPCTLCFASRGSLTIFLNGAQTLSDPEWNAYHAALLAQSERHGQARVVIFAGAESATPTPRQRKLSGELAKKRRIVAAVVTDSLMVRGVVTAMRWMGVEIDAVKTVDGACAFLKCDAAEVRWVLETHDELRRKLARGAPAEPAGSAKRDAG
jgi:hypothetical protein